MQAAFTKRWHSQRSSFHLLIGEMTTTLDDVSCLMHLPIRGRLLDHRRMGREEAFDIMVTHLGDDPGKAAKKEANTRGAHARFSFFGKSL